MLRMPTAASRAGTPREAAQRRRRRCRRSLRARKPCPGAPHPPRRPKARRAGAARMPAPSRSSERAVKSCGQTRGKSHERLGDGRQEIAKQRDGLAPLQLVRQRAGEALHDVLQRLGEAIDQADNGAAGVQRPGQEHRQDGIQHFGRDIGEEARQGEQEGAPRKPAENIA